MGHLQYPNLPHPCPTTPIWQIPPDPLAKHRTTVSLPTHEHDYIIIGSGISGAAIAYKLLERNPQLSVLMLEARTAASGASGRNGGHCRAGYWLNYLRYIDTVGEDEALKIDALEEANVADIAAFVAEHRVDCDFEEVETADIYHTEAAWAQLLRVVDARAEVARRRPDEASRTPRRVLNGDAARQHTGMPRAIGAVTWRAYTQNPYRLVCAMLQLCLKRGLNLQTTTPALRIREHTGEHHHYWSVDTPRGALRAKNVVLATNGYSNHLHRALADTAILTPGRSQATAIEPGSRISLDKLSHRSAGLNDISSGDYTIFREGPRQIVYGGGKTYSETRERGITDDSVVHEGIAAHLHTSLRRLFNETRWGHDGAVLKDWTGITGYTNDTFPLVGGTPGQKGLWMSVGFNGHGMALTFRSAEALVQLMTTGHAPDWLPKCFRAERAWDQGEKAALRVNGQNYLHPGGVFQPLG
ncbi:hypothetical protein E4U43_007412 [Claviceps pusilla]|uniref:FAD dependent oxidoreductase domain-containing protein n=1 Tax=Claviceps pusilla TaxID=123648 RepID=A0A9P7T0L3_9HYPO|nr:hypothetical protein E4U43_007412 [Claviceps pusilla]